jgi:hypothetical protein
VTAPSSSTSETGYWTKMAGLPLEMA